MSAWTRFLMGGNKNIDSRNALWNMAGSAIYALTSMVLGAIVTRVLGADAGGIFFFAFSTFGQQMYIGAYFGIRPLQITDTAGRYSFGEYRHFRYVTCALSMIAAAGYAFLFSRGGTARTVLLLMVVYKILDGFADCYDSEFQRQGRLDLTGKSNAFRTLCAVAAFLAVMMGTRQLVPACAAAVAGQAAGILFFDLIPVRAFPGVQYGVRQGSAMQLFRESRWLFLSAFLDLYIFAASKYAVNRFMTDADNSYYTTIFIPTSVINLMANFVIRPVLTKLAEDRDRGDGAHFLRIVFRISALIAGLTVLGMTAAWLFGIPALSLLVGKTAGEALRPYRGTLVTVILGGGFYAFLNLLYYILVIFGRQRDIFLIYCGVTVFARVLSDHMVRTGGIGGAAMSYLIAMAVLALLFAAATVKRVTESGCLQEKK